MPDALLDVPRRPNSLSRRTASWIAERLELARAGEQTMYAMEGLRGAAVFLVFVVHFASQVAPWFARTDTAKVAVRTVGTMGQSGVDLFFVISGMLIYGMLMRRRQSFVEFMGRRVRRIYPAFLTVFAIYIALALAVPSLGKLPASGLVFYLLTNLLLLPGLLPITPLITVAWSLSYEMFFYVVTPPVLAVLRLRDWTPRWRMGWLALLIGAMLAGFGMRGGPVEITLFLFGALLHELMTTRRQTVPGVALALGGAGLALCMRGISTEDSMLQAAKIAAAGVGFGLLCWSALALPRGHIARLFSFTPVRWLGNMSYSYYLAHSLAIGPAFKLAALLLPPSGWGALGGALLLVPVFVLSLVPSLLLFLVVERPLSLMPSKAR